METYEQIEQRLYRCGGKPWRQYRQQKEVFIKQHGGKRRDAQKAWSVYFMKELYNDY